MLPIYWMCLIWLNIDLFYWIFVLTMFLYIRAVITWTLLHFPVSCWIDIASRTCWTVVGSFLPMLRIHKFVLFLAGKARFQGLFFLMGYIWHVAMFTVLCNDANRSTSWCLIWLNTDLFYWRIVLTMFLSIRAVITWTLLHFTVSCWLDIASRTFWTVVGSFLQMLRIYKFVLFLAGK